MAGRHTGDNAHAVGVNGKRAAIIDRKTTNPEGWESDRRPSLKSPADKDRLNKNHPAHYNLPDHIPSYSDFHLILFRR